METSDGEANESQSVPQNISVVMPEDLPEPNTGEENSNGEDQVDLPGLGQPPSAAADDDDEDAPRIVWEAEPETDTKEQAPRPTESMTRRAMRKISKRLSLGGSKSKSSPNGDDVSRGSSLSRFFGVGSPKKDTTGDSAPERRGSSLARMLGGGVGPDGEPIDIRGGSIGRIVFSEGSDGKLKAFRGIRKLTSRARKSVTGLSSKEAADALEESRKFQQALAKQESQKMNHSSEDLSIPAEERLMAAVGARRREWQMVYSHLYMKGLGMGGLVDKLLRCGITLADFYSLSVEDEDADSQAMGFDDFDSMFEGQEGLEELEGEEGASPKIQKSSPSTQPPRNRSTLDEDLAIDTGCSIEEAKKMRHAIMAFYKCEKALGYLKGHGFDGVLERILKLGLLPDDVRAECLEEDPSLHTTLEENAGLAPNVITALTKALVQYDKVQAALNEFDSLSMSEETSFQMNLGMPMGLRLDDDTLVVLSVEEGGQAHAAGVPVGCRVLAVGGETVTIVEDAIGAIKRMRDAGNFECIVVYKEFNTESEPKKKKEAANTIVEGSNEDGEEAVGQDGDAVEGSEKDNKTSPQKKEEEAGEKEEEQAGLPGMDQLKLSQEGQSDEDDEDEEEMVDGRASPSSPDGDSSSATTKPKRDRRASWDMTQTILTEKRGNANANLMEDEEFKALVERVTAEEENEVKMAVVAESVGDHDNEEATNKISNVIKDEMGMKLLNSQQIIELCGCTPSVKTKLAFLEVLIPRCTDPSDGGAAIIDLFRFTGDKERVSDALKIRASALKAGMQMVASSFVTGNTGATGASAAAVAIAGVTYSASSNTQNKRRGSLGGGVGGSTSKSQLQRDSTGMISNPLLRKQGTSHKI